MNKPWKKLSLKITYKNSPYWHVEEHKVIRPDGNKGTYAHIRNGDFVVVIPLLDNDKSTYLVRQWRYPIDQNSWELSMGKMEKDEKPLQSAKREFEEELGLKAKKWQKIGYSHLANGISNEGFSIFVARDFFPGEQKLESTELDMIIKKVSLKKVNEMIAKGQLTDSPTITAMYYLNLYLKKL